ncbi:MAG TPA: ATP-binding protein [Pyrinomonadaceae bacterium]
MKRPKEHDIVVLNHFIEATRDSGYKGTAAAIAELIDNSFEANAYNVDICITEDAGQTAGLSVIVTDDGKGMTPSVLRLALQFGGSTRFNSRKGTGRYGMGLPNSSLSRAKRVDVYTWNNPKAVWWSYLDVDEIAKGQLIAVPQPKRTLLRTPRGGQNSPHGTVVVWTKCDRLDYKRGGWLASRLHRTLGRIFRRELWQGRSLTVNSVPVCPVDPLFLREGGTPAGATQFGPPLQYEVAIPGEGGEQRYTAVTVIFTELPIDAWHGHSNEEKRRLGITKNAGVSVVRAGREIDYGWFFMGCKRKENYDDWWRCEVQFDPILDELFGVTNTKQGISPRDVICRILEPDLERIAHQLNSRVRTRYAQIKSRTLYSPGQHRAEERDPLITPPVRALLDADDFTAHGVEPNTRLNKGRRNVVAGLSYRVEHRKMGDDNFFVPLISSNELVVILNEEHPFYTRVYAPIAKGGSADLRAAYKYLELMLFAAARAECGVLGRNKQAWARNVRRAWSKTLAAFLD